ncbi:radical SAM protein [Methylobacterium sp. W2]|uniref:radical SAM protein n=1 Tax=Methylobacterium sp. W2 TaxID=2598107 RepID=UPI001D0CCD0B|nr:radical SAM protein [Methylobacterium sp. W2]MCC0807516.1 radical SAM protein [Methylobacterium sp. W2]
MWQFPHENYIYDGMRGDLIRADAGVISSLRSHIEANPDAELEINGIIYGKARKENMRPALKGGQTDPVTIKVSITEQCNLVCGYCPYPENDARGHSPFGSGLPQERLDKATEFAISHLSSRTALCFYGGEPLYRFKDIAAIVSKVEKARSDWSGVIALTTNMTLCSDKIANYLIDRRAIILVSCDGPKEINDRHRPTHNGMGTFDKIMANMARFKALDEAYYRECIGINCVVTGCDFDELDNFFATEFGEIKHIRFSIASNSGGSMHVDGNTIRDELFDWAERVILTDEVESLRRRPLLRDFIKNYLHPVVERKSVQNERKGFTSCSPGERLYINTDGSVGVCERTEGLQIGDISKRSEVDTDGVAISFADMLENRCKSCFAAPACSVCYAVIWDGAMLSHDRLNKYCSSFRGNLIRRLSIYAKAREKHGGAEFDALVREVAGDNSPIFDEIE